MPENRCEVDGQPGWKWGDDGKCYTYTPGDEDSEGEAKQQAIKQGIAMGEHSELATMIDVPVITTGVFQGHKGPPVVVDDMRMQQLLKGSNRFQPLLKQALQTGELPGNPTFFERLGKPMPAPITLNHQVLKDDKIRDSLRNVDVEFSEGVIDGKPWILGRFSGVDELAADIIRRFFTKRSVEILDLTDPDTGETLPTIISTAFLDRATPPAVPGQTDNLLVEFSALNESHYIIYPEQRSNIMPEETKTQDNVAELHAMQAALSELQKRVDEAEAQKAEAIELAKKADDAREQAQKATELRIMELKAEQSALKADKLMAHLTRTRTHGDQVFQLSPAFSEIAEKAIRTGQLAELAEGQDEQQRLAEFFDQLAELACQNGLLIPLGTQGSKAYTRDEDAPQDTATLVAELKAKHPEMTDSAAFIAALNRQYGGTK